MRLILRSDDLPVLPPRRHTEAVKSGREPMVADVTGITNGVVTAFVRNPLLKARVDELVGKEYEDVRIDLNDTDPVRGYFSHGLRELWKVFTFELSSSQEDRDKAAQEIDNLPNLELSKLFLEYFKEDFGESKPLALKNGNTFDNLDGDSLKATHHKFLGTVADGVSKYPSFKDLQDQAVVSQRTPKPSLRLPLTLSIILNLIDI